MVIQLLIIDIFDIHAIYFTGVKDEAAFNVALVELAGHLPIKSKLTL